MQQVGGGGPAANAFRDQFVGVPAFDVREVAGQKFIESRRWDAADIGEHPCSFVVRVLRTVPEEELCTTQPPAGPVDPVFG